MWRQTKLSRELSRAHRLSEVESHGLCFQRFEVRILGVTKRGSPVCLAWEASGYGSRGGTVHCMPGLRRYLAAASGGHTRVQSEAGAISGL